MCGLRLEENSWDKIGFTHAQAIFCNLDDWSTQSTASTSDFVTNEKELMCDSGDFVSGVQASFDDEFSTE